MEDIFKRVEIDQMVKDFHENDMGGDEHLMYIRFHPKEMCFMMPESIDSIALILYNTALNDERFGKALTLAAKNYMHHLNNEKNGTDFGVFIDKKQLAKLKKQTK